MENSGGIQASLSGRYALALFELARDTSQLDSVAESLAALKSALGESAELRSLTTSPVIGRDAATRAVAAVGDVMGLDALTKKFLGVMAQGRRLSQLGAAIRAFEMLLSNHKGESRAEVTSAHPLAKTQVTALEKALKARVGRDVAVDLKVDPTVLGGLVVKIGSQMIDSSIRTRLNSLAQAMKG
ncbi:MAG: F0F1 ATP synthase subunit delta [Sphingobium sp.]|nr:F0F1 ATP synthase subunit delta [Sphingobium sp.]MBP6111890.1 F0F1 ATP synthase subunit delta [Sphingobium sp.]MBP8670331.1 F0F1 ATP synthase subunit delta [Sphingobium sp.]MBP9157707.1 F0F1 ATP synthase subunit delta [Sphingobium sp.]MCC6482920.1 F0F1 ATP synthase subunit delta [Sphingomonadaceae bacterium]